VELQVLERKTGLEAPIRPTLGGSLVTGGGLVFIGATLDRYLRVLDVESGAGGYNHPVARSVLVLLAVAATALLASPARAGVTVDLLWLDNGLPTITVSPFRPGQPPAADCSGFENTQVDGRCAKVVWTTDEPIFIGSTSVAWDTGRGLEVQFASFFSRFNAIPVGKASAFEPFPDANVGVDNVAGLAGMFTGKVDQFAPGDGVTGLPAGTWVVGTIVFSERSVGVGGGTTFIDSILQAGFDGFIDLNNQFITDITLNGATLRVEPIPEPGTAALLGGALLALAAWRLRGRR